MTAINQVSASAALSLGKSALDSENYVEAHSFFTHVLETEPTNTQALMGKGLSAGWQSNLRHSRLQEMLVMYRQVKVIEPKTSQMPDEMVTNMLEMLMAYDRLSREHTMQFISVDNARYDAFDRAEEVLMVLDVLRRDHIALSQQVINPLMIRILKAQIGTSGCMGDQLTSFKNMLSEVTQETPDEIKKIATEKSARLGSLGGFLLFLVIGLFSFWIVRPHSLSGILLVFLTAFGTVIFLIGCALLWGCLFTKSLNTASTDTNNKNP
jgi:hypothetical protein